MPKQYKTARGKTVDMSQILAENENVRAVGNMNVNARGDAIDSKNKVVESRNKRVKKQYGKQHKQILNDDTVPTSKRQAQRMQTANDIAREYSNVSKAPLEEETEVRTQPEPVVDDPVAEEQPQPIAEEQPQPTGGLAAAIAKARESQQEVMKTDRQQAREDEGVKRI